MNTDATRVALVLDAGGARSAYQVGALDVLLPALAERGARPRLLVGTSAGALLTAALTATAHLDSQEQVTRLEAMLAEIGTGKPGTRSAGGIGRRAIWQCTNSIGSGVVNGSPPVSIW